MSTSLPFTRLSTLSSSPGVVVPGQPGYVIHVDGFVVSLGNFGTVTQGAQFQLEFLANSCPGDGDNGSLVVNLNPSTTQNVNFSLSFNGDSVRAAGENSDIKAALSTSDALPTVNLTIWGRYVPVSD